MPQKEIFQALKFLCNLFFFPPGELAPALSATINITGNLVDFVLVHMGNDR